MSPYLHLYFILIYLQITGMCANAGAQPTGLSAFYRGRRLGLDTHRLHARLRSPLAPVSHQGGEGSFQVFLVQCSATLYLICSIVSISRTHTCSNLCPIYLFLPQPRGSIFYSVPSRYTGFAFELGRGSLQSGRPGPESRAPDKGDCPCPRYSSYDRYCP